MLSRLYRDNRWIEFREEVLEMDGYACVKCGRTNSEVVLQVHHKEYQPGKPPWDYPPELCETLCKGCHAREHGEIRPNDGWALYLENDLGGLYGECECCGTSIRYVFHIHHEKWEPLAVGTVCCDNLTGTTEATEYRKRIERRKRFIQSKRWKHSLTGLCIEQGRALEIEIRPDGQEFRIYMNRIKGNKKFLSEASAKAFVFDTIESGEAQAFAKRHPLPRIYP